MSRLLTMKRLSLLFFGLFAVLVAATLVFQRDWVDPGADCVADGNWYDIETRTCATPISIAEITGRPIGVSRAEASAQKNRELVDIERRIAQARVDQRAADAAQVQEALGGRVD